MTGYDDNDDDRRPRNPSLSLITALALLWHLFRLFFFQRGTKRANGFLAKQESAPSSIFVESGGGLGGGEARFWVNTPSVLRPLNHTRTRTRTHTHTHSHTRTRTHSLIRFMTLKPHRLHSLSLRLALPFSFSFSLSLSLWLPHTHSLSLQDIVPT